MDLNRDGKVDARDRAIFQNVVNHTSNNNSTSGNPSGSSYKIRTQESDLQKNADIPTQSSDHSTKDKLISIAVYCVFFLFISTIFSLCKCHLLAFLSKVCLFLSIVAVLSER